MEWKITLAEPDLGQEEIDAVTSVLKSKWLTMGSVTIEFEKLFAEKMNVKHAFAVGNATLALHLANVALGINSGDEVICPALTFVASANATKYTGADVVFADVVSNKDFTIDPDDIRKKVTQKTKAITVVHYAGFPCLMDEIVEIANEYDLKIIEDCAHAPFAFYNSKNKGKQFVGSIGDVGCFSFFGNKNMTTGEGGMITTNDDKLAEKIRLLRSHGMTTLTYERHKGHVSGYDVVDLGFNYRIDEIRSAIGIAQLNKVEKNNLKRREIFKWYCDILKTDSNVIIPFERRNHEESVFHIMTVIIKNNYDAIKQNLKNAGIQTSKHYDLITKFKAYRDDSFISKVEFIDNIMTLPMYHGLKKSDIELIGNVIKNG